MFLVLIIVTVTIIAIIVNKGVKGIEKKEVRHPYLIVIGFLIQIAIFNERFASSSFSKFTPFLYIVSLLILLVFLITNFNYNGIKIALIGFILNLIVIIANGGYMPQDLAKLNIAGLGEKAKLLQESEHFYNAIMMSENTYLNFLGDIIVIPQLKPIGSVYSIGDIFIIIGICVFIFEFFKREIV